MNQFLSLRKTVPPITIEDLRKITSHFPAPGHVYPLDPSHEEEMKGRDPDMPPPDPEKVAIFKVLQRYNRLNLLVPVDAPHMWHAAMNSKGCKLTTLGEHYRRLVARDLI